MNRNTLRQWTGEAAIGGNRCCAAWLAVALLWSVGFRDLVAAETTKTVRRYLLVVDTSFSMSRCGPAARAAVTSAVTTGLQGRMRDGDAFELWTFDAFTRTRNFSPQVWMEDLSQAAGRRAAEFMARTRFEGQGRPEVLMRDLSTVLKHQPDLVVVIVTDGEENFQGSPFDSAINAALKARYRELRQARIPYLVVLEAQGGQFRYWSASAAGEALRFAPSEEPTPLVKQPTPAPVSQESVSSKVESSPVVQTPKPEVSAVAKEPAQAVPNAPAAQPQTRAATANVPAPQQKAVPVVKESISKPTTVLSPPTPSGTPVRQAANPPPPAVPPAVSQQQVLPPSSPPPAARVLTNQPGSKPVAASPSASIVAPKLPTASQTNEVTPVRKTVVEPSEAMMLPQRRDQSRTANLAIAGGLLVLAVALVGWLVIQRRNPRGPSLITKSMDHLGPQ